MQEDPLPQIAEQAAFYLLERRAMAADELRLEEVPALLAEIEAFLKDRSLESQHLRLASATIAAVNRLEDPAQREKYFQKFGRWYAESEDRELARYGKKLVKQPGLEMPQIVGQPLELAGLTALGTQFDWKAYRGKVVLVDFWATFCGPCRKAMPKIQARYDALRSKGFDVVGVSLDRSEEDLGKYLEDQSITWENIVGDDAKQLAEKYGVRGIPTLILVDRDGTVAAVGHKLESVERTLEKLLAVEP
jgi:thiol-disulfide isomerase/thioredoxin